MILRSLLSVSVRPAVFDWIKQSRCIRPTIRIGKDRFQISLDVKNFNKEELRVKARSEYVIIEGKQERKTKDGLVVRQFARKYKLPKGCDPGSMRSTLSADGILTVTAPRSTCTQELPCDTVLTISYTEPKDDNLRTVQTPGEDKRK